LLCLLKKKKEKVILVTAEKKKRDLDVVGGDKGVRREQRESQDYPPPAWEGVLPGCSKEGKKKIHTDGGDIKHAGKKEKGGTGPGPRGSLRSRSIKF